MELRELPSVDKLAETLEGLPWQVAVDIARASLDQARHDIARGADTNPTAAAVAAARHLVASRPQSVINATGVLLHTNLGRAPLLPAAADAAAAAATGYGNVELSLADGSRGGRGAYVNSLLTSLTGAEEAMVVNNNAGALYLALTALANGKAVPVSRGELIEIGGSYRLPELMRAAGTRLIEVGTTNRTRAGDYESVIDESVALLLKVHPSNYRVAGFTDEATLSQLIALGRDKSRPVLFDAGSGLLDDRTPWLGGPPPDWLTGEPGIRQAVAAGADLTMFSGDKLLGGPQAGILVGSGALLAQLKRHPVTRALRVDGPTMAALAVTLESYANGTARELPFWKMALAGFDELEARCRQVAEGFDVSIKEGASTVGAGSVPGSEVPTPVIAVSGASDRRYLQLLSSSIPIVARRERGDLVLDLRSVPPEQDETVRTSLEQLWR